jgi:hypothetical protein
LYQVRCAAAEGAQRQKGEAAAGRDAPVADRKERGGRAASVGCRSQGRGGGASWQTTAAARGRAPAAPRALGAAQGAGSGRRYRRGIAQPVKPRRAPVKRGPRDLTISSTVLGPRPWRGAGEVAGRRAGNNRRARAQRGGGVCSQGLRWSVAHSLCYKHASEWSTPAGTPGSLARRVSMQASQAAILRAMLGRPRAHRYDLRGEGCA